MHTALHEAGMLASKRLGRKVDPYDLPLEDRETYALIRTGRNAGMFQLESPGQMHLSRRLGPRRFRDLVAQISLFRPGPVRGDLVTPYVLRRNGLKAYSVPLPELEEVLKPTYGVLVFQEQVLEVAHRVAGFTLAEGDRIRRAMTSDRGPGAMDRLRAKFVRQAVERGVPAETARQVFSWTEGFSVYGFSAAHGASFAELSYASAYMKRHFPASLMRPTSLAESFSRSRCRVVSWRGCPLIAGSANASSHPGSDAPPGRPSCPFPTRRVGGSSGWASGTAPPICRRPPRGGSGWSGRRFP
ncbi:MAG: hypothetical protein LC781_07825 [Actinobacteria bacterium]|nr:hypothetical protein [Actinomycetota bacterium]